MGSVGLGEDIRPDGRTTGVRILVHAETPGLGAKFIDVGFLKQFIGKSLSTSTWKVKKDGGDFDQITGATITPRALVAAIADGLETFNKVSDKVLPFTVPTPPTTGGTQ